MGNSSGKDKKGQDYWLSDEEWEEAKWYGVFKEGPRNLGVDVEEWYFGHGVDFEFGGRDGEN